MTPALTCITSFAEDSYYTSRAVANMVPEAVDTAYQDH